MNVDTIKETLEGKKATILNIKSLKKITSTSFVFCDSSGLAVLETMGNLKEIPKENTFLKMIKPLIKEKNDDTVRKEQQWLFSAQASRDQDEKSRH